MAAFLNCAGNGTTGFCCVALTAYNTPENEDGSSILNIPHHLYQLNLMAPLFTPELRGGLDMQTLSSRKSFSGKVPGYTRLNLSLLYQPIKSVDLSASVYDLLNSNRIETAPWTTSSHATGRAHVPPQNGISFLIAACLR